MIKIILLEDVTIPNLPMFFAGKTYDVPEETAKILIERRHAELVEPPRHKSKK